MRRIPFWLLLAMTLSGCQINSRPGPIDVNDIYYFEDSRTHVCFAAINSAAQSTKITSISVVSCAAVMDFLQK